MYIEFTHLLLSTAPPWHSCRIQLPDLGKEREASGAVTLTDGHLSDLGKEREASGAATLTGVPDLGREREASGATGKRVLALTPRATGKSPRFHSIRRGPSLYWDRPLPVIVQYQGIGSPMPKLNATCIQTAALSKPDSNSKVWAPISTSKQGVSSCFIALSAHVGPFWVSTHIDLHLQG
jgi:hypothetical protein